MQGNKQEESNNDDRIQDVRQFAVVNIQPITDQTMVMQKNCLACLDASLQTRTTFMPVNDFVCM